MRNELGTYILFVIAVYISGAISWLNNFSFVFWTTVVRKDMLGGQSTFILRIYFKCWTIIQNQNILRILKGKQ